MTNSFLHKDGVVITVWLNVAKVDIKADIADLQNLEETSDEVIAGMAFDGETLSIPEAEPRPIPVPESVTRAAAKIALNRAGLLDSVESAVAATESKEDDFYLNDAPYWRRRHPVIAALGAALALNDAQIDDLFRVAASIDNAVV